MKNLKSEVSLVNILIRIENITGVYRNFNVFGKKGKITIIMGIAIASVLSVENLLDRVFFLVRQQVYKDLMLFFLILALNSATCVISLSNFIIPVQQASKFYSLMVGINYINETFKDEDIYSRALRKLTVRSTIKLIVLIVSCFLKFALYAELVFKSCYNGINGSIHITLALLTDLQFYIELLMFYAVTQIYIYAVKQMDRRVISLLKYVNDKINDVENIRIDSDYILTQIENLHIIYDCLKSYSNKIKHCFCIQVCSHF